MIRIIIDIEEHGDKLATKEAVAMVLEQFGKVRVVMVTDGKEPIPLKRRTTGARCAPSSPRTA